MRAIPTRRNNVYGYIGLEAGYQYAKQSIILTGSRMNTCTVLFVPYRPVRANGTHEVRKVSPRVKHVKQRIGRVLLLLPCISRISPLRIL